MVEGGDQPRPGWYPDPANDMNIRYYGEDGWTGSTKPRFPPPSVTERPAAQRPSRFADWYLWVLPLAAVVVLVIILVLNSLR